MNLPALTDHNTATVRTTWSIGVVSALVWLAHVIFDVELSTSDPLIILIAPVVVGFFHRLSVVLSENVPYFGYLLFGVNRSPEYTEPPPDVPALAGDDNGQAPGGLVWLVVGILLIIALALWIAQRI